MRRRFSLNEHGLFVDRDGNILGKIVGITVDLTGDIGGSSFLSSQLQIDAVSDQQELDAGKSDDVGRVWRHYQTAVSTGGLYKLNAKRRRVIQEALKVRTLDQVLAAIDGLAASSFHNGRNDRGKKYLGIQYALAAHGTQSNDERIDEMGARVAETSVEANMLPEIADLPSEQREIVRERERHIREGRTSPDQSKATRGRLAEDWFAKTFGLYVAGADSCGIEWERRGSSS